jgi:hypothetical protein
VLAEGLRPSRRRVEALLPHHVRLREPSLRGVWRGLIAESFSSKG